MRAIKWGKKEEKIAAAAEEEIHYNLMRKFLCPGDRSQSFSHIRARLIKREQS
jgi:hypothetical protein